MGAGISVWMFSATALMETPGFLGLGQILLKNGRPFRPAAFADNPGRGIATNNKAAPGVNPGRLGGRQKAD